MRYAKCPNWHRTPVGVTQSFLRPLWPFPEFPGRTHSLSPHPCDLREEHAPHPFTPVISGRARSPSPHPCDFPMEVESLRREKEGSWWEGGSHSRSCSCRLHVSLLEHRWCAGDSMGGRVWSRRGQVIHSGSRGEALQKAKMAPVVLISKSCWPALGMENR